MKSVELDWWRNYFRTANSDIFDIIENAIAVAASDCPKEFTLRRDRIAEKLFTCKLTRCSGCSRIETDGPENEEDEGCKIGFDRDDCELEAGISKGSKVNSTRDDHTEMNMNPVSNFSYGEAEALTDEMEEEGQIVGEVYRIKELLQNWEDESDSVLFESLRRLQLMALTVDTLKATEIGKAVNVLRKHGFKDIRQLARLLIDEWKDMVDDWVNARAAATAAAKAAVTEGTPDSVNPSVLDEEEGLPSPPLDDGIFFETQPPSMDFSQFFDGMDDDGNLRNTGEGIKRHEVVRKPPTQKQTDLRRKPHNPNVLTKEANNSGQLLKRPEAPVKPSKPLKIESGPGRPQKLGSQQKVTDEAKYQQKQEKVNLQKRPPAGRQEVKYTNEDAVQMKLEATKRRLQENYQQAQNAKKQRTIQVMELHDLPKQGMGHRNPHLKPGQHNRHWANGRR